MMMKLYFTFFQNTSWSLENINLVTFHEPLPSFPIHFLKRCQQLFCIVCFCFFGFLLLNSLHQFFFIHSTFTPFIWKHYILPFTLNVALGSHCCICFLFPRHQSQVHDRLFPHRTQDFEWRKPMRGKTKKKTQENWSVFSVAHFLRKTELLLSKISFKVLMLLSLDILCKNGFQSLNIKICLQPGDNVIYVEAPTEPGTKMISYSRHIFEELQKGGSLIF